MASKFVTTDRPGVYLRGRIYYASVTQNGVTKRIAAGPKKDDAVRLKRQLEADRDRGKTVIARREKEKLRDYALSWIESYGGRGQTRIGEVTRASYRTDLTKHVLPRIGNLPIGQIRPRTLDDLVKQLQDETRLQDPTIVRVLAPLRACLADAHRNEDIATNPALGLRVRRRPRVIEDDGDPLKVLTRTELAALIEATHPHWRVLIELFAGTGLRINEALALRWIDLDLGNRPTVHVVRAIKGKTMQIGPPKSRAGRRRVPLPVSVAQDLRLRRAESEWSSDDDPVFPNAQGGLMDEATSAAASSPRQPERRPCPGAASTRCATGSARCCSRSAATSARSAASWATATPASPSASTCTCWTATWGGPLDLDAALGREPVDEAVAGVQ